MSKRAKIESLYIVISTFGTVCGVGIDPSSAWRDAVANSGSYTNWKDMALSGSYGLTSASASTSYEPAELAESFTAWGKLSEELYGKVASNEQ